MTEEISNRTLAILLVVAIAISLGGTIVSLNRLTLVQRPLITGMAETDTGTATINISSTASLYFSTAAIAFGNGWVNSSEEDTCEMSAQEASQGLISPSCKGSWAAGISAFVIENNGNVNLSVDLQSDRNASMFVGVPNGMFQFMVNETAAGSCNSTTTLNASTSTSWFDFPIARDTGVCEIFDYNDNTDDLYIHIRVNISYNSNMTGAGQQSAIVTASGTALP